MQNLSENSAFFIVNSYNDSEMEDGEKEVQNKIQELYIKMN